MGVGTEVLERLGQAGQTLCFDISHTAGQYPGLKREALFEKVLNDARHLAPFTKLIHVNTVKEPFNGTDSHDGILPEDFKNNVFPNRDQLKELLTVFKNQPDIWLIPEPESEKMIENYFELKKLVQEIAAN